MFIRTIFVLCLAAFTAVTCFVEQIVVESGIDEYEEFGRYTIEGRVYAPELYPYDVNWQKDTAITINDGEYNGFLREDGTFVISSVPSGSYVVDIVNPDYLYESVCINKYCFVSIMPIIIFIFRFVLKSIQKENSVHAN